MITLPFFLHILGHGDLGVDAFFVLSGFLVAAPLFLGFTQKKPIQFGSFYKRRFFRICPLYFFILFLYACVDFTDFIGKASYFLLFVQNFLPIEQARLHHLWSLCVEVQFYVFIPLFIFILTKMKSTRVQMAFFILVLISLGIYRGIVLFQIPILHQEPFYKIIFGVVGGEGLLYEKVYMNTFTRCWPLFFGAFLAYLHTFYPQRLATFFANKKTSLLLFITALICIGVSVGISPLKPTSIYYQFPHFFDLIWLSIYRNIFSIGIGILVLFGVSTQHEFLHHKILNILKKRMWLSLSTLAYPLYLFHIAWIMISAAIVAQIRYAGQVDKLGALDLLIVSVLTFLSAYLFSILIHLAIEKPGMLAIKRKKEAP